MEAIAQSRLTGHGSHATETGHRPREPLPSFLFEIGLCTREACIEHPPSAAKHPRLVAAYDSRRPRSFSAVGHAFQAGLVGGLAATHRGEGQRQWGHRGGRQ